jgi:D-cysteine desulfhydrase family pyridoxal phosphate-dependent enzyme
LKLPGRVSLGTFPTPLEPLPRLSAELGFEVLVKREDLSGLALGGNKVRKLEMLMAQAQDAGARRVITCGSVQSNHCRCTAAAARRLGLECALVLFEGRHNEVNGNHLLDQLLGAEIQLHPASMRDQADTLMAEVAAAHPGSFVIPFGGSDAIGAAAYVWGYQELVGQLAGQFARPGAGRGSLYCVTSSGATHAGLALGEALTPGGPQVFGVSIADPVELCSARVAELAQQAASVIGVEAQAVVRLVDGQQGGGYGVPSAAGQAALLRLARVEGLLLDPVYTAKAMAGLIDHAGGVGGPVVFLHSGGTPALFAYAPDLDLTQ